MIIGVADGSIIAIIMRNHMTNALARYAAASDGDAIAALAISMPGIDVSGAIAAHSRQSQSQASTAIAAMQPPTIQRSRKSKRSTTQSDTCLSRQKPTQAGVAVSSTSLSARSGRSCPNCPNACHDRQTNCPCRPCQMRACRAQPDDQPQPKSHHWGAHWGEARPQNAYFGGCQ